MINLTLRHHQFTNSFPETKEMKHTCDDCTLHPSFNNIKIPWAQLRRETLMSFRTQQSLYEQDYMCQPIESFCRNAISRTRALQDILDADSLVITAYYFPLPHTPVSIDL